MKNTHEIPKVIHYCWFGRKPLPDLARKCIASWKKYMPEYEIKCWDESNTDFQLIRYANEAYKLGKYAFVSDYLRYYILYTEGGVYFDTDVELISSIDDIVKRGPFMGLEKGYKLSTHCDTLYKYSVNGVSSGLGMGCYSGMQLFSDILSGFDNRRFIKDDGKIDYTPDIVTVTSMLKGRGLVLEDKFQEIGGVVIYPTEYFCPLAYSDKEQTITKNTRSIHHFAATWVEPPTFKRRMLMKLLGSQNTERFVAWKDNIIFQLKGKKTK